MHDFTHLIDMMYVRTARRPFSADEIIGTWHPN